MSLGRPSSGSRRCCATTMPNTTATRPAGFPARAPPCSMASPIAANAATRWSCSTRAPRATCATICASSTVCRSARTCRPIRLMPGSSPPFSRRWRQPNWRRGPAPKPCSARRRRPWTGSRLSRLSGCAIRPPWPSGSSSASIPTTAWSPPSWSAAGKRRCARCARPRRPSLGAPPLAIRPVMVDPTLETAFIALGRRLPELWWQPVMTRARKKALLRCLIDKVVLHRQAPDRLAVRIVWRGGETTPLEVSTTVGAFVDLSRSAEMEARILALARAGVADATIAETLTAEGHRSPHRRHVLVSTVQGIRLRHRILRTASQSHPRTVPSRLTVPQLADMLRLTRHWIYDRIHNGTIAIARDTRTGLYLFPDTPDTLAEFRRLRAGEVDRLQFIQTTDC